MKYYLALPYGLPGRILSNWVIIQYVEPDKYVMFNNTYKYKASDFHKIMKLDILSALLKLLRMNSENLK